MNALRRWWHWFSVSRRTPTGYEWLFAGLPEMGLFETPVQRREVLNEVGRPRGLSIGRKLSFAIPMVLCVTILMASRAGLIRNRTITGMAMAGVPAIIFMELWQRRAAVRRPIREKLLSLGVPVCLECGYSLRGAPPDSSRCPECGTEMAQH